MQVNQDTLCAHGVNTSTDTCMRCRFNVAPDSGQYFSLWLISHAISTQAHVCNNGCVAQWRQRLAFQQHYVETCRAYQATETEKQHTRYVESKYYKSVYTK